MTDVKRTERGWAGHFICSASCLFRRNTLLELGETRVVVSTVGLMRNDDDEFEEVGIGRHFETMAFHADAADERYRDADVHRQVRFESEWSISELDADDRANDMHEAVVAELTATMEGGGLR